MLEGFESSSLSSPIANRSVHPVRGLKFDSALKVMVTILCCLTIFGIAPESRAAAKKKPETITEISFRSNIYGPCRAHVARHRARFEWGMIIFLLNPPDYTQMFIVNPSNKCYRKQVITQFLQEKWGNWKMNPTVSALKKTGEVKVHNLKCDKYICMTDNVECEFTTTTALNINPELAAACCLFVGLPQGYGIPISAAKNYKPKQILQSGDFSGMPSKAVAIKGKFVQPWLTVRSVSKSKLKETDLKLPGDYKKTDQDFALWFSKDGSLKPSDLEDFYMTGPSKITTPKKRQ